MALDVDFFCANADAMHQFAPATNGCCPGFPDFTPFPGCAPNNTSQWMPYSAGSSFSSTFVDFFFPWPVIVQQFIACNFSNDQYGGNSGPFGAVVKLILGGVLKASLISTPTERTNDAGNVWDINLLIPTKIHLRIIGQNYRTCNSSTNNNISCHLTGQHLRGY